MNTNEVREMAEELEENGYDGLADQLYDEFGRSETEKIESKDWVYSSDRIEMDGPNTYHWSNPMCMSRDQIQDAIDDPDVEIGGVHEDGGVTVLLEWVDQTDVEGLKDHLKRKDWFYGFADTLEETSDPYTMEWYDDRSWVAEITRIQQRRAERDDEIEILEGSNGRFLVTYTGDKF